MLSEVTPFHFQGFDFYVKRDETIDPLLSGNKYRKLYSLLQTPAHTYQTIMSYGGTQSNAMLSIAALCRQKGWFFHYYCKPIAPHLKQQPSGNLLAALDLGMLLFETNHDDYETTITQLKSNGSSLLIPQGGADAIAQQGIEILAQEIRQWQQSTNLKPLYIVTPSGTGTTAFYLASALPEYTVLTSACIANKNYLITQMQQLGTMPDNLRLLQANRKFHFAQPYPELLHMYEQLKTAGITFDLLYAPQMWLTLLEHMQNFDGTVLYVHSGGLMGNATMLERYQHKGLIT